MRIARFPSLTEPQFFGCVSAFADSLTGELNAASAALRRLESSGKGAAFAFEMALDRHRYGIAIVLDRWSALLASFGPHLSFPRARVIVDSAPARIQSAETVLANANRLIDASPDYSPAVVEACYLAFRSVEGMFRDERDAAVQDSSLGPMLPEEYVSARRIFLEDLAHR